MACLPSSSHHAVQHQSSSIGELRGPTRRAPRLPELCPRNLLEQPSPSLQASESVSGRILWANLHLLFWLSLAPFATAWMGQNHLAPAPVSFYGFILLCAGIAYFILTRSLVAHHREDSQLAMSVGNDRKGRLSIAICTIAIPFAFVKTWAAYLCYVLVAVMWLLPDPRIEKAVHN